MYKKAILFGMCVCIFSSISMVSAEDGPFEKRISELSIKLLDGISSSGVKPSVAIMSFYPENEKIDFNNYLGSVLFEKIFVTGKVKLIERENIDKILSEQNFQLSGNVNDDSAKSIGYIIGVDYVCYGFVTDLDRTMRISGKMVDVTTGEIVSIASVQVVRDQSIVKLLNNDTNTDQESSISAVTNENSWKVETNKNEFDGYTSYLFTLRSYEDYFIFIECTIFENSSKSVVKSGFSWNTKYFTENPNIYEIKGDNNKLVTLKLFKWYTYQDQIRTVKYIGTNNSRNFIDLLLHNDTLAVRAKKQVISFSTYGFSDALASVGLRFQDLDTAMRNSE